MTLDEIKADIVSACREFQEAGYTLYHSRYFADEGKACGGCAVVAVAKMRGGIEPHEINEPRILKFVEARYGWDEDDRISFTNAYDNEVIAHDDCGKLGRIVRAEVLPIVDRSGQ